MNTNNQTLCKSHAQECGGEDAATTVGGTPALQNQPLWQTISGIDPQTESEMTRAERNAALRKLVAEVTERATVEFADEDQDTTLESERTIFWDPLQRICMQLGISRTKLSAYSRELTGMRAHEISDRILAKRKLMGRLSARVEKLLRPELEEMRKDLYVEHPDSEYLRSESQSLARWMKSLRKFEKSASFAAEMGFANFSRLNRACLLAFGKSLDQIEAELVCTYVQKFFSEVTPARNLTQSRKDCKEQPKKEASTLKPEVEAVFRDAIAQTLGIKKEEVRVA